MYLKHEACARYPADVGEDEACLGRCQMQWLTTFNPSTLAPTYAEDASVTVPMGIVYADKRAAGNWYISIAASDTVANFSLVAQLVESLLASDRVSCDVGDIGVLCAFRKQSLKLRLLLRQRASSRRRSK